MVCPGLAQKKRSNMAKNETVRIRPSILQEDRDAFAALKTMTGYTSAKPEYEIDSVQAAQDTLVAKRDVEAQKQGELDAARDDAAAAEWAFHNAILGAKDQVVAKFGDDSNELQSLGLKKKSEYKSPTKSGGAAPAAP
jgi:hypothetical protein